MKIHHEHAWDLGVSEARRVQEELERHVVETPLERPPRSIAGVDVSVKDDRARAAVAVLSYPDLEPVDFSVWEGPAPFPYIPGLLSFREVPVILPALEQLTVRPDVLMTDSQGRAHPRRMGLACHLGVLLDWPTLGVAKSKLTGTFGDLGTEKGNREELVHKGDVVGVALRTRTNVKPVYVSVGHRITLDEAIDLTLRCSPKYKIPEPTRQAHTLSRKEREE